MNFKGADGFNAMVVVKFTDNLRFSVDSDNIVIQLKSKILSSVRNNPQILARLCTLTDLASSEKFTENIQLKFHDFFRGSMYGVVELEDHIEPKDFTRYQKGKPYLLAFSYDNVQID